MRLTLQGTTNTNNQDMATEKRLKKSYLDEAKRDQILQGIEIDRQALNDHVAKLKEMGIDVNDVETLRKVSPSWCKDFVKDAEAGYLQNLSPFVVKTVQSDVHEKFADSYQKAAPLCQAIETIRNRHKFNIKIDSKGHFWFDEKETKPFAVLAATTTYSDEEIEFFNKAMEIFDAINDFEKWAESNGFGKFFTKEQAIVWMGGTSTKGVINLLTDMDTVNGFPRATNHITFNADVFRNLLAEGFISKNE
jgi:hypothetical protein